MKNLNILVCMCHLRCVQAHTTVCVRSQNNFMELSPPVLAWPVSKADLAILLSSGNCRGVQQPSPVCVLCVRVSMF